jgi:hypothetical protein
MPIELLSTNTAVLKIMIDVRRLLLRDGERGGARSALNEATHDQRSVAQPLFRRLPVETQVTAGRALQLSRYAYHRLPASAGEGQSLLSLMWPDCSSSSILPAPRMLS